MHVSINKLVKIFGLLAFLVAIINLHFHNLYQQNLNHKGAPLDEASHILGDILALKVKAKRTDDDTNTTTKGKARNSNNRYAGECYRARKDTVPLSRYGKLQPPFINLGFPKIGSSSIHSFFTCAGYRGMHYRCRKDKTCAECIKESVKEGLPNAKNTRFSQCGKADVYSQIDTGSWGSFPQMDYLEEIVGGIPNATFFLSFRSMDKWYHSISHWPPDSAPGSHMSDGLRKANITGFPTGMGKNQEEFSSWFCNHVTRVRQLIANHPSQTLVEIDIEDSTIGQHMSDIFDVHESCWGHANANPKLNPDKAKPGIPWFVRGKICVKGKTKSRPRNNLPLPPPLPGFPPWNDTMKQCD